MNLEYLPRSQCQVGPDHAVSRRALLGGLLAGGAGLGVEALLPQAIAQQLQRAKKQLLIVYHAGGLSQLESWDPKPGTSTGGPLRQISTSVTGIQVAEWLPYTARQMHHLTVLRSLSTNENNHGPGAYLMMTGRRQEIGQVYPSISCIANRYLTPSSHPVPGYISVGETVREAAFLGARFDPVKVLVGKPVENLDRLSYISEQGDMRRGELRRSLDRRFTTKRNSPETAAYAQTYEQAAQLMANKNLFDVGDETPQDADRYGKHEMGQQCLLARRLLERGVTCVKVTHPGYDTHAENFNVHLDLLEQFDRPFAALIEDLAARDMLQHTVVVAIGEFGRTPGINTRMGRDHWSHTWSAAFAGCNFPRGRVVGKTNATGQEVVEEKVTAPDLFHTMLTALDIDPLEKFEVDGQSIPIGDPAGSVVEALLT